MATMMTSKAAFCRGHRPGREKLSILAVLCFFILCSSNYVSAYEQPGPSNSNRRPDHIVIDVDIPPSNLVQPQRIATPLPNVVQPRQLVYPPQELVPPHMINDGHLNLGQPQQQISHLPSLRVITEVGRAAAYLMQLRLDPLSIDDDNEHNHLQPNQAAGAMDQFKQEDIAPQVFDDVALQIALGQFVNDQDIAPQVSDDVAMQIVLGQIVNDQDITPQVSDDADMEIVLRQIFNDQGTGLAEMGELQEMEKEKEKIDSMAETLAERILQFGYLSFVVQAAGIFLPVTAGRKTWSEMEAISEGFQMLDSLILFGVWLWAEKDLTYNNIKERLFDKSHELLRKFRKFNLKKYEDLKKKHEELLCGEEFTPGHVHTTH